MSTVNKKFTTTRCATASKARVFRCDIGPLDAQFDSIDLATKELKRVHHRAAQETMFKSKDDHCVMLLQLLAEANHFHTHNTKLHVCKINREVCEAGVTHPAGLSTATMKALVTDVDIVMNDDDKDNYQHALSAIAALSLWH